MTEMQTESGRQDAVILAMANAALCAALQTDLQQHQAQLFAWGVDASAATPAVIIVEAPDIDALVEALQNLQALPNAKSTPLIVLLPPALMHEASHCLGGWNHEMLILSSGKEEIVKHVARHLRTQAILAQVAALRAREAHAANLVDPLKEGKADGAAERLRIGQSRLLEMIAQGRPLQDTLRELTLLIESQTDGLYCSVLLLDEDGVTIHIGAGPNLPESYMNVLEGYTIGPMVGSCGTAMYRKELVIVSDIDTDPLWAPYKSLVIPHGFLACWSSPILLNNDAVLGTFAMYYREVRSPTPGDLVLLDVATHIAGIAIERTRREEELKRHRNHLEDLVRKRTHELSLSKERAEQAMVALTSANLELAAALASLSIAQEELVRSKKLAALGSLVSGIAHELNTPIGNCLTTASAVADQSEAVMGQLESGGTGIKRSELVDYVGHVRQSNELLVRNLTRAANLIARFKQINIDPASAGRRRFDLHDLVADTIPSAMIVSSNKVFKIDNQVPGGLELDSYPVPLSQAIGNLLENCDIHAFDGHANGTVTISAHLEGANEVELTVSDDGIGISVENLDRIFDPFFTTKLGQGGSGLGLNVVHNILSGVLGGRIRCESRAGEGARFVLTLPLVAPSLAPA